MLPIPDAMGPQEPRSLKRRPKRRTRWIEIAIVVLLAFMLIVVYGILYWVYQIFTILNELSNARA